MLVSDHGRGLAASLRAALAALDSRVPVVWDPRSRGCVPPLGVRMVTPNLAEARLLAAEGEKPDRTAARTGDGDEADGNVDGTGTDGGKAPGGRTYGGGASGVSGATEWGRRLVACWHAATVAVTLGERSAVLVDGSGAPPLTVPAVRVADGDTCGAGDMFAMSAATSLAGGAPPAEAVVAATEAASAFVAAGAATAVRVDGARIDRSRDERALVDDMLLGWP